LLLWHAVCASMGFGSLLTAAGYTLIPIALSGGIHMDGLADVIDAQSSHAEPARKREILKDPHVGAFAIIGVCCYLVAYVALASEVSGRLMGVLACVPVVSRCLSGFATVCFRTSSGKGMLASERGSADLHVVRVSLALELAAVSVALVAASPLVGVAVLVTAVVALAYVRWLAQSQYGGMSGDLAGYFLQLAELCMLACIVFVGRLV
jgi:adenosylcobinamide-GDP ribazoletransferase